MFSFLVLFGCSLKYCNLVFTIKDLLFSSLNCNKKQWLGCHNVMSHLSTFTISHIGAIWNIKLLFTFTSKDLLLSSLNCSKNYDMVITIWWVIFLHLPEKLFKIFHCLSWKQMFHHIHAPTFVQVLIFSYLEWSHATLLFLTLQCEILV